MCKKCPKCGRWLLKSRFSILRRAKDGLCTYCKDCVSAYGKAHYAKNKELVDQKHREWYAANKEARAVSIKAWQNKNKKRLRVLGRKRYKKYAKELIEKAIDYISRHRENYRIKERNRRKALAILPNTLTKEQWQATLLFFNSSCAYCGSKDRLERDHIVPITAGGGFVYGNIVPACKSCNSSKGPRTVKQWQEEQENLTADNYQKLKQFVLEAGGESCAC